MPENSPGEGLEALSLAGLVKVFGQKTAVDGLDLHIPAGAFFGLVGPNGAGKTTTLSMATGLLRPDKGRAHVFGIDIWENPVPGKALLGVLPEGLAMPERLTGREYLTYLGLLRGMDKKTVYYRVAEILNVFDLEGAKDTLIIEFSTGMRKKIGLAAALLHNPKLLVLDEPFENVDPVSAANIKIIFRKFIQAGGSIIFSSHVMVLVEQLCSHAAIIIRGKVVVSGTLSEVRNGQDLETRLVQFAGIDSIGEESLSWLGH
jgi:ABC-2 type transport system ATP-binding protein